MPIAPLLARYGYLAIFVGTVFEGETILVLGGVAAHARYLELWGVLVAAFAGTLVGDQLYFQLGRHRGRAFLERRPRWRARVARVQRRLQGRETALILGFRFLYGIRTVTPFVLGMSGVAPLRFALLNAVSAAAWATVVGCAGYALGTAAGQLLGHARRYEEMLFAAIVLVGASVWIVRWTRGRREARDPDAIP